MPADEQAIRDLQAAWLAASAAGDLSRLLPLLADDVVFLTPGRPPFGKQEFAVNFTAGLKQFRINASGDAEEIVVVGNVAYARTRLSVSLTPLAGGEPKRMAGYALTVFRKQPDGRWLLSRDANLAAPVASS